MYEITHNDLVARAARWLTNTRKCQPVYTEQNIWAVSESPDAIGWTAHGSVLVECKVSMSDFYRDSAKLFRKHPDLGVGLKRYYMTPPGLISKLQLPKHWGLLECHPKIVKVVVVAQNMPGVYLRGEIQLLRAAALNRRKDHSGPKGETR